MLRTFAPRALLVSLATLAACGDGDAHVQDRSATPTVAEESPLDDGGFGDLVDAPGSELVVQHCVACHGPSGRGGHPNPHAHGDVIPALAPLMSTYKADELKAKLERGVIPDTHDGRPAAVVMPAWKDVLSEEAVIAWGQAKEAAAALDPDMDARFLEKAKPFIEWLQEASSSEEESD